MTVDNFLVLGHPIALAVLGACVGSFLNVVIHRVPRRESVLRPGSRCPSCAAPVRPWDNVPILSWLWLRGKCRACSAPISPRYPLVEAMTAAIFGIVALVTPGAASLAITLVFVAAMIAVTFIDFDHMIIPDAITLPGTILGLAVAFSGVTVSPGSALLGIVVGAGGLWTVAVGYRAVTGRDGLGGGDVKLLAMVGAFLGPAGAFLTILIGSIAGTVFAGLFMLRGGHGRTAELPFGTFLAPGAVLVLFFGARIVESYWGFFA
jgi:leader peptidase (prepilin peptidase)/N-methyltransferase